MLTTNPNKVYPHATTTRRAPGSACALHHNDLNGKLKTANGNRNRNRVERLLIVSNIDADKHHTQRNAIKIYTPSPTCPLI